MEGVVEVSLSHRLTSVSCPLKKIEFSVFEGFFPFSEKNIQLAS